MDVAEKWKLLLLAYPIRKWLSGREFIFFHCETCIKFLAIPWYTEGERISPSKWQANCWPLTNPRPVRSAIYVLVVCTWWRGSPYWKASPNECGAPVKWWRTKRLHTKIIRTILDSITIDYGKQRETTGSVLGVGAVNFRLWDGHSDSRRHRMLSWTGLQLYTNTTTILLTTGV